MFWRITSHFLAMSSFNVEVIVCAEKYDLRFRNHDAYSELVCLVIKIHTEKGFSLSQLAETFYLIRHVSTLQAKWHQFLFRFFPCHSLWLHVGRAATIAVTFLWHFDGYRWKKRSLENSSHTTKTASLSGKEYCIISNQFCTGFALESVKDWKQSCARNLKGFLQIFRFLQFSFEVLMLSLPFEEGCHKIWEAYNINKRLMVSWAFICWICCYNFLDLMSVSNSLIT